jgi:hypothetical protein
MYVMSTWALVMLTLPRFRTPEGWVVPTDPVPWVGLVLLVLAAVMLVEAIRALGGGGPTAEPPEQALVHPILAQR